LVVKVKILQCYALACSNPARKDASEKKGLGLIFRKIAVK
jgi:hypothetical protein